jgi:hypothetical protein
MKTEGGITLNLTNFIIVESLTEKDRKTGKGLYEDCLFWQVLKDKNISADFFPVSCFDELKSILLTTYKKIIETGIRPLLHFEFHGNESFFTLMDKIEIPWIKLTELLVEINIALRNSLIVIASACYGAHLISTVDIMERSPFFLLIGPKDSISEYTLLKGVIVFYQELFSSFDIGNALKALKATDSNFKYLTTEGMFIESFKHYVKEYCRGSGLENRIGQFISNREKEDPNLDKAQLRNILTELFAGEKNISNLFYEMASKYFMIDLFPELSQQLAYDFNDVYKP